MVTKNNKLKRLFSEFHEKVYGTNSKYDFEIYEEKAIGFVKYLINKSYLKDKKKKER